MDNIIELTIQGFKFKLLTKPGVFSATKLDEGTKVLLDNLEVKDETLVADLGSGTGMVGFLAAKLNPNGHIHLLEDHVRSFELAKENSIQNRLKNVEVYLSDLFSVVPERTYHQILSNPPQQLGNDFLEEVVSESYKHLKNNGQLWLVVKNNVKPFMKKTLEQYFKSSRIVAQGKGHSVLKATK